MEVNDLKKLYIAHRGIQTKNTIENTIPAFSLAIQKKVPIELDTHILKDGNIVVFHDPDLKRLMDIDKKIADYTYEELKQITFPDTNLHIPLFTDILDLVSGKVLLVIEMKKSDVGSYQDYCKKMITILENYPYDFVIKSFDIRIVNYFLKHTNYITGLLIANRKKNAYDFLMQRKSTISILKPDFISVDRHIVSHKLVQDFRKIGPVFVWTIKNQKSLDAVKDYADSYLIQDFYF